MKFRTIEDLRAQAQRKIPAFLFDYIEGGSIDEITLRLNRQAFAGLELDQRALSGVGQVDVAVDILGERFALPFGLAPVGLAGVFRADGELAAAQAASAADIAMCLSTFSVCAMEDVASTLGRPPWFQLYMMKERGLTLDMIARARAAKIGVLVLTVDTPVAAPRDRDVRNGFGARDRLSASHILQMISRPMWLARHASSRRPLRLQSLPPTELKRSGLSSQMAYIARQIDPSIGWQDVAWLREHWPGQIILKGILTPRDARRALAAGVDGIVVSNHGGRQLDGVRSTIDALPAIADTLGGQMQILFDSGVRRGTDIVKALALGADGVLLGRAFAYGLAADGRRGVDGVIETLAKEVRSVMALMGVANVPELKAKGTELVKRMPYFSAL